MPVFHATQVSREICMFQMMVVDIIIADVKVTLEEMEKTNCKLPQRLETLQGQWRQQKASIDSWASYFRSIGVSLSAFQSESAWIADCVNRAGTKGPKYGSAKGEGKGKGGGKSGSKGWGRR